MWNICFQEIVLSNSTPVVVGWTVWMDVALASLRGQHSLLEVIRESLIADVLMCVPLAGV